MNIAEGIALLQGTTATIDGIAKTYKAVKEAIKGDKSGAGTDLAGVNQELSEALEGMLLLKQTQLKLLDMLIELKQEKLAFDQERAELDRFRAEAANYIMKEISPHSFAYVLKDGIKSEGASPYLCARCFQQGKKSLLQLKKRDFNIDTLECNACSTPVSVPNDIKGEVYVVPTRRQGWPFDDY
ncbi:hypothetical protein ABID16_000067 [Rhizobium aquaticum]|uniref:Uncharacterized protein n=1 Tax=Rhizobium aquaticum TaxID=1549636 RepID=A0ABV2ITF2_9HYPH